MATKKFVIEVEERPTNCSQCPFENRHGKFKIDCDKYNLTTMKIKEYEDKD